MQARPVVIHGHGSGRAGETPPRESVRGSPFGFLCLVLALLLLAPACASTQRRAAAGFSLEYQGRGWSYEDAQRAQRIQCDLPPQRVDPGPYPYRFNLPRKGEYYLLMSLIVVSPPDGSTNTVRVLLDGKEVDSFASGPNATVRIMPENPAIRKVGTLDEGTHTLEFSQDVPEGCLVVHWGVADNRAMELYWQRREPWVHRNL